MRLQLAGRVHPHAAEAVARDLRVSGGGEWKQVRIQAVETALRRRGEGVATIQVEEVGRIRGIPYHVRIGVGHIEGGARGGRVPYKGETTTVGIRHDRQTARIDEIESNEGERQRIIAGILLSLNHREHAVNLMNSLSIHSLIIELQGKGTLAPVKA